MAKVLFMSIEILTVTDLTRDIKNNLEIRYADVIVKGEISNLARPGSGHLYFQLKDNAAQIASVLFRFQAQKVRFELEEGLEVLARGRVSVYEPRGQYQLILNTIEPVGAGALQLAFEQLKKKLAAEGLFDIWRKKSLPYIPKYIGIVTSPTGAAIQDILNVLERRFPSIPVLIYPVLVQGDKAAFEISQGIKYLDSLDEVDVIFVGRGGGSIEDLWAFNEEILARTIVSCGTPVISGVGHEVDFTITDSVADYRAPTPSAAAEILVPDREELAIRIDQLHQRLGLATFNRIQRLQDRLYALRAKINSPKIMIHAFRQRIESLDTKLKFLILQKLMLWRQKMSSLYQDILLYSPKKNIDLDRIQVLQIEKRVKLAARSFVLNQKKQLDSLREKLIILNPINIMNRGYSALTDEQGKLVKTVAALSKGSSFQVRIADGSIKGTATDIIKYKALLHKDIL